MAAAWSGHQLEMVAAGLVISWRWGYRVQSWPSVDGPVWSSVCGAGGDGDGDRDGVGGGDDDGGGGDSPVCSSQIYDGDGEDDDNGPDNIPL